jgi:CRISPR/Cas system-associated exonuclease Cas4 (RecB family)
LWVVLGWFWVAGAAPARAQTEPRPERPGRKYKVRIDSAPQQAAVYLDDEKYGIVGYTPWDGRLQKGEWKLILKKDGYETTTRVIQVKRSSRVQETFVPMARAEQPVVLDIRPDADPNAFGAEVLVDGQPQGQLPALIKVDDGRHHIEVRKNGFEQFSQWVSASQGERITITPVLRAIKVEKRGSVLVDSDPPGAEVYVDGNRHTDLTPTLVSGLLEGPHVVEVRKEGASVWKQTVNVTSSETAKVNAAIARPVEQPRAGSLRVVSNVEKARVFVDGSDRGAAPLHLADVLPGEHLVEVRAIGYQPREQRVNVEAGAAMVLQLELQPSGRAGAGAQMKVVSPVPEAVVFIDGERLGPAPQARELSPGDHFVVVSKEGWKSFEQKVHIKKGEQRTITAELRASGGLRFLSNPVGAEVYVDGKPLGVTPLENADIEVGPHVVSIRRTGHRPFEQTVMVEGGKTGVVNATLLALDDAPTPEQQLREQRGITSFSATALGKGRSAIDIATGYPYYVDARITVGAGRLNGLGFDAGVLLRTFLTRTDLGVTTRLTLVNANPFSAGLFGIVGGGTSLFDDSGRNNFFFNAGLAMSLTGLGAVTVTGRAYFDVWSDRLCPALISDPAAPGGSRVHGDAIDTCKEYQAVENGMGSTAFSDDDKQRVDALVEESPFDRDVGVRAMLSLAVEVAIQQRWSLSFLFEGAPFQGERAAYTNYFNGTMFNEDPVTYLRMGTTYKF